MKYRNQKERNKKRAEKTAETREQRALSRPAAVTTESAPFRIKNLRYLG